MKHPGVTKALMKFFLAIVVLASLTRICFLDIDVGLRGTIITFNAILTLPITILLGIDASRVINRELPSNKSLRILGKVLAFPQAVFGTILIGFGVGYPVFGVPAILDDLSRGVTPLTLLASLIVSALGFGLGFHYLREGLGLGKRRRP
jgi:hypothetical protein